MLKVTAEELAPIVALHALKNATCIDSNVVRNAKKGWWSDIRAKYGLNHHGKLGVKLSGDNAGAIYDKRTDVFIESTPRYEHSLVIRFSSLSRGNPFDSSVVDLELVNEGLGLPDDVTNLIVMIQE